MVLQFLQQLVDTNKSSNSTYIQELPFNLPITYLSDKYKLANNVKLDLELIDDPMHNSLYKHILSPTLDATNPIISKWVEYYTNNIPFLKDSQHLLKHFCPINKDDISISKVQQIIGELENETGFCEKYKFINIKLLEPLNQIPRFLQMLTVYNLTSPIVSLAIPILMLILPLFILRIQGISISVQTYVQALMKIFSQHVVGKAISQFSTVSWDRKIFMIVSIAIYFVNIYQNVISCHTFYKNIHKIRSYLGTINNFLQYSISSINNLELYCKKTYKPFLDTNLKVKEILVKFTGEITAIKLDQFSIKQIGNIGITLHAFYELFSNKIYKSAIKYSVNLDSYIDNINCIKYNIDQGQLNFCNFTKKNSSFSNAYFVSLINNNPIKNNYSLNKNILITGPNAAGKTTLLKTTLFNIILSQQLGVGCYKNARINPYTYIHSYINIPDTSQRDSLFQAEARRCKEILDCLTISKSTERHFCIFDEIYSGTNPSEAIASAYSFLKHISNYKNLDYILTTHYISLCEILINTPSIINKHMEVIDNNNTYQLVEGISKIKGGIKVLEDLNYDNSIIEMARKVLEKINI
jgi:energy-coupling factor transporter ATP-binding protein EcfA2